MKCTPLALVISAVLASGTFAADAPAPVRVAPEFTAALKELTAPEFARREAAGSALEHLLAADLRLIIDADSTAARERVKEVIEFDEGLTRWALDLLKLPQDERKSLVAWGLDPANVPIVAKVYSSSAQVRLEGVRALANAKGDAEVSYLLATLLEEDNRDIHLAAMEVAWDRKPTEAVVEALWKRAISIMWNTYFPRPEQQAARIINNGMFMAVENPYRRAQDSEPAADTLIHFKSPLVQDKLRKLFQDMEHDAAGPNAPMAMASVFQTEPGKQLGRLLEAYKTPEALPTLTRLASQPVAYRQQQNINGKAFFMSNRTPAIAMLALHSGLDPAELKMSRVVYMGNAWTFATEKDEEAGLAKLQKMIADKAGKTAPAASGTSQPAATAPAETQPAEPAPAVAPAPIQRGAIHIQGGAIQIQGGAQGGGVVRMQIQVGPGQVEQVIINGQQDAPAKEK